LEPRRRIPVREERRAVTHGDVRVESDRVVGHGCGKRSDAGCGVARAGNGFVLREETGSRRMNRTHQRRQRGIIEVIGVVVGGEVNALGVEGVTQEVEEPLGGGTPGLVAVEHESKLRERAQELVLCR